MKTWKAWIVLAIALAAGTARAQVSSASPGELSSAHAAFERQCERCHVAFGGVPTTQCLHCHRDLGERIARGVGFHATVTAKPCSECHAEHRGRGAALSPPPPSPFDHRASVFPLEGQHAQLSCERCHPGSSSRWVGVPTQCARCHADRAHAGKLGSDCAKCHRATDWKPTRTLAEHELPITGAHASQSCESCHRGGQHLVAHQACGQCHVQTHGGTKEACTTCHSTVTWKDASYAHHKGGEQLPGPHKTAPCLACHPRFRFRPTSLECAACHDRERPHQPLGDCANCHSATSWKTRTFDHDRPEVGFALTGKHRDVACEACHPASFKGKAAERRTCASCHADPHRAQFGAKSCDACHATASWRPSTIDASAHTAFGYELRGAHVRTACADCHRSGQFVATATACASCHPDARHRGRFGSACERCHRESSWAETPSFDHATTGFALDRGHANVACASCHGRGGLALAGRPAPSACATCHATPHGKQFSSQCAQCHTTSSFRAAKPFDHAATAFPLELRHSTLACSACHDAKRQPIANGACRSCHGDPHRGSNSFDCSDCHRADRWRVIRFDHDLTDYPLVGRHRVASCGGCHANPNWSGVRTDCAACHALDRPRTPDHLTTVECADCHDATSWRSLKTLRRRR
jgi:hypothetical protein